MTDKQLTEFLEQYKDIPEDSNRMAYVSVAFLKEVYFLVKRYEVEIERLIADE